MAQGEFTKEEADATKEAVDELFKALPKSKQMGFIGHLNDIFLFIEAAKRAAPGVLRRGADVDNEEPDDPVPPTT
jgi:hypothetical protein